MEVAKYRAQTVVLKKALLDQRQVIKELELAARPVERFTILLSFALILSKRPIANIMDFLDSFIKAIEDFNNENYSVAGLLFPRTEKLPESNLVNSAEQIRMKLLRLMHMGRHKEYGVRVLELLRNLVIQVNGLISSLNLGLCVSNLVKSNLVMLVLDSETFLYQAEEFYKAVKEEAQKFRPAAKVPQSHSSIAANLMSQLYLRSRDAAISPPVSSTIKDNLKNGGVNQSIQTDEAPVGPVFNVETNDHALLQQYSIVIQTLVAKSKSMQ